MEGKYLNLIFFGLFLHITVSEGYTAYHAAKLESDLLTNYSPKVRPYSTTPVSLDFGLMHITELNIVTQTLHCVGFIVAVSSWLFLDYHIPITSPSDTINFDIYEQNGEWDITGSSVQNISRILSGHHMPAVKFTLNLSRKYSYYLMNMLLPVIILAVMAPFVFLLPAASGEKIGYALTILLSLSVVMTLVSDNIPPTSTNTCILSVYLLMIFMICSLETLLTVWICRIHDIKVTNQQLGHKMNKFTSLLVVIMRYRRQNKSDKLDLLVSKNTIATVHDLEIVKDSKVGSEVKKAWKEETDTETKIEYTPDELIYLFDRFNFYMFIILTVVVTAIIMVVLQIGGQAKQ